MVTLTDEQARAITDVLAQAHEVYKVAGYMRGTGGDLTRQHIAMRRLIVLLEACALIDLTPKPEAADEHVNQRRTRATKN